MHDGSWSCFTLLVLNLIVNSGKFLSFKRSQYKSDCKLQLANSIMCRLWKRENGAEVDFCPLTSDTTKTHHFEDSKEEGENWNKNTPNPLNAELHEKEISSLQSEDREVVEKEREDREANEENQDSIVNEKENEIDLQDELQGIEENFSGEKEEVLDEESELEEDQGTFSSDQIQGREKLPPAIIHIAYSNERYLLIILSVLIFSSLFPVSYFFPGLTSPLGHFSEVFWTIVVSEV